MASSNSLGNKAPDRLGNKVPADSSLIDFLCCNCNFPVFLARQIIACGCRICEPCFLVLEETTNNETRCGKCHTIFEIHETFRDKASDNELKRRRFPCFYIDCSWEGNAFEYRDHVIACGFADMKCTNLGCNQIFLKKNRKQHEIVCKFRVITCQWCDRTLQLNETEDHELSVCLEYELLCPSGCGASIKRRNIREHVDHFCKKQTRPCSFMHYGCTAKGRFDTMEQHKKEAVIPHMEMLAKFVSDNQHTAEEPPIARVRDISRSSKVPPHQLQTEVKTIKEQVTSHLNQFSQEIMKLDNMIQDMHISFQELSVLVQTLQATSYNGHFIWKIPEIQRRREEALLGKTLSLYSAPFFTSRFGYKLCLRLYLNGDGSGKGTHISFFLTIMKGEYDALLPWPFSQMVTLTLLDYNKRKNITQCFKPEPSSSSFWRPHSEMNIASGCPKFAFLSVLSDPNYIQEDTMFFKAVIDLSELSQP